ncbi:hypothetical protein TCAL_04749 [Tigriopus californicus]|uniref:Carbohydrate kinase PfkB domain-containing protein n=1 Tax=Tigriopus californicus TaxID=6832 RepID=A0A553P3Y4_TIGCA|nr:uncharacterized protein LOC131883357 [Tigriopus californicus]TRY72383.1 hypothetical protein TCAL_04749 [Tigriopus californicus]|eukprot:TCALIF_04749-PA protein Name:"Similar to SPBC1861.05 Pseudouridine-metabolizing bifunctional protein C1861.05 (Schizosaccharomyces pombe (strain 972 / ATCC 24843))" AED:0.02 eAED:0.02 QI:169/1/0.75/1/1/1/4/2269/690
MYPRLLGREFLRFSPEVQRILHQCQSPWDLLASQIVLLESAILTHGMPYPTNLEMAHQVQNIIRDRGAVPATVGIISGKLHIGLTDHDLAWLARPDTAKVKVSRRDLPAVLARGGHGGTTVAGTLLAARQTPWGSLPLFVTGGIGGVHRAGQNSMDVSADLVEMGRSSTTVISAGIKSILDIGRTLEYLETQGVCVGTLGETDDFPAFFTRKSGFRSPVHVRDERDMARLMATHHSLNLDSGILMSVPIPAADEATDVEEAIQQALALADEKGITGREVTPFVLGKVNELSQGASLKANLALIKNNARVGADIAVELAQLVRSSIQPKSHHLQLDRDKASTAETIQLRPMVVGGSILDLVTHIRDPVVSMDGSTHLGTVDFGYGGVGRNLADALALFDLNPMFISAVGADDLGRNMIEHNEKLDKSRVAILSDHRTAMYNIVLDCDGAVRLGVGDMSIHTQVSPSLIQEQLPRLEQCSMLVLDGNLPQESVNYLLQLDNASNVPVFYEPTDVRKSDKFLKSGVPSAVTYFSPNLKELFSATGSAYSYDDLNDCNASLYKAVDACVDMLTLLQVIIVTMGDDGVLIVRRGSAHEPLPLRNDPGSKSRSEFTISATHYPVRKICDAVSCSGAGDCLSAAFITSILNHHSQGQAVAAGIQAAALSLGQDMSVPTMLSRDIIDWQSEAKGRPIL